MTKIKKANFINSLVGKSNITMRDTLAPGFLMIFLLISTFDSCMGTEKEFQLKARTTGYVEQQEEQEQQENMVRKRLYIRPSGERWSVYNYECWYDQCVEECVRSRYSVGDFLNCDRGGGYCLRMVYKKCLFRCRCKYPDEITCRNLFVRRKQHLYQMLI